MKTKSEVNLKATITNNLCKSMLAIESNYQKRFFYPLEAPGVVSQAQAASLLINSPYFEDLSGSYFRLKKETSASKAIVSILKEGTHHLDCGSALLLAQYNAIRLTLIDFLGEEEGKRRFDSVFGSEDLKINDNRRLLISKHLSISTHPDLVCNDLSVKEVNPLSFFIDFTQKTKRFDSNFKITDMKEGHFCFIAGHPEFAKKHSFGHLGGYNVLSLAGNKFLGFGLGNSPISSEEICDALAAGYNRPPNQFTKMSPFYNQSLEFLQCSTEEMPGFQPSSVTKLLYKHLEELINNPNELTKKMDLYLLKSAHKLVRDQCNSVYKYSNIFNENKICLDFLKIEPKPVSISDYNPTLFSFSNNSISTTEDKTQLEIFPLTNNMYFELNKATLLLYLYVNKKKEVGLYIDQNTYQKIQSYLNDLPGLVSYLKDIGVTGNTMAEMIESNEKTRISPSTLF